MQALLPNAMTPSVSLTDRHFQPVTCSLFVVQAGARPVHCQLAFLVLLQTMLPSLKHTKAFDPVFTGVDIALLQTFDIEVYSASKLVKRVTLHSCLSNFVC